MTRKRGVTSLPLSQTLIDNIKSANLIVGSRTLSYSFTTRGIELPAAVVWHRKLLSNYILLKRKSRFHEYRMFGTVETTSMHTVESTEDVVPGRSGVPSRLKVEVFVDEVRHQNAAF